MQDSLSLIDVIVVHYSIKNEVPKLQPREIHTFFASSTISQGFILNKLPCLIVQTLPNVYVKLFY